MTELAQGSLRHLLRQRTHSLNDEASVQTHPLAPDIPHPAVRAGPNRDIPSQTPAGAHRDRCMHAPDAPPNCKLGFGMLDTLASMLHNRAGMLSMPGPAPDQHAGYAGYVGLYGARPRPSPAGQAGPLELGLSGHSGRAHEHPVMSGMPNLTQRAHEHSEYVGDPGCSGHNASPPAAVGAIRGEPSPPQLNPFSAGARRSTSSSPSVARASLLSMASMPASMTGMPSLPSMPDVACWGQSACPRRHAGGAQAPLIPACPACRAQALPVWRRQHPCTSDL